jgi:hypothetical protein
MRLRMGLLIRPQRVLQGLASFCHPTRYSCLIQRGIHIIVGDAPTKIVVPDPTEKSGARTQVVVTAHLRCSSAAAADLKRAIDSALPLAKRPASRTKPSPAERTSKPN